MRRCPECSFIYEDDQRLCDMDGTALVPDPGPLPDHEDGGSKPGLRANSRSRRFAVPAIAGIVLVAVLFAVYYLLTHREAPQKSSPAAAPTINQSSTNSTTAQQSTPNLITEPEKPETFASSTNAAPAPSKVSDRDRKTTSRAAKSHDNRLTIPRRIPPLQRIPPLSRLPPARVAEKKPISASAPEKLAVTNQKPASTGNKKESRVSSLLKKTGRVLTKPFRF